MNEIYLCVKCQQEIKDLSNSTIFCKNCKEAEELHKYQNFNQTKFLSKIAFTFIIIGIILVIYLPFDFYIWGLMFLIFIYSFTGYWIRYKKEIITKKMYILGILLLILFQIALGVILIKKK